MIPQTRAPTNPATPPTSQAGPLTDLFRIPITAPAAAAATTAINTALLIVVSFRNRPIRRARAFAQARMHPSRNAMLSGPVRAMLEIPVKSLGLYRFDRGQVDMSQENSTCDHTLAEKLFAIRMCPFETELAAYADQVR